MSETATIGTSKIEGEIIEKFEALNKNQYNVKQSTANQRKKKLKSIVKWIQEHEGTIQQAMYLDMKRSNLDTTSELLMVKLEGDHAAQNIDKWMKPHIVPNSNMSRGTKSYYLYEPKGVVMIMAPWNAPFACTLVPLIGAVAAGNTIMVKPSELAPHSSKVLKRMLNELFDRNEIAVVEGGVEEATTLLNLPFNHIYFTGGPNIGKIVMRAAAQHLTSITLELGGKSPAIVDEAADVKSAAKKIGWGRCANSGQACIAPDYALVHYAIEEDFIHHVVESLKEMYDPNKDGFDKSDAFPRIINNRHFNRIKAMLEDALEKGATLELGGETDEEDNYISPTVLSNVTPDMLVMQEEIFGPLLPIMAFQNKEEVIDFVNSKEKPLALYIYSTKKKNADYFLNNTSAGSTVINHNMIQAGLNPNLPFGGVNNSGMGRSVGKATFASFSNQRSVVEQPTGWKDFSNISFPPYTNVYKRMINYLFKN